MGHFIFTGDFSDIVKVVIVIGGIALLLYGMTRKPRGGSDGNGSSNNTSSTTTTNTSASTPTNNTTNHTTNNQ